MPLPNPFNALHVPPDLTVKFIAAFARCEYAMKSSGYRLNDNGRASPAWSKLAQEAPHWMTVAAGSEVDDAIEYLCTDPPKVESFDQGWVDRPLQGANRVTQAISAVTRVRNNLFHGGKHLPESWPGRDRDLVIAALTVLIAVVENAPGVADYYAMMPQGPTA